ncbi:50S ribosomal protein L11 methyltransferase [Steroidobacter agaridevorans]|uniref:50S ribosomal protein L11 methyltransferase n=1 Tax=Steroidobacter agaridevorans TaxID=2695856 RepID=UPI00132471A0|nr:50S ribosomal protein L11 methyltransferase [Steroidobacter agaridevorans]GFE88205.1 ribosomal protein L11 methyltransferase [Steroidobacter agaridevorans]
MPFLQLILPIGAADPAPYEDALLAAGASSITLEDEGDDPVLEPLPGTTPLWPRVRLKALFEGEPDTQELLQLLRAELSGKLAEPLARVAFETLEDRAWEREWLKDFRPMRFGERLWICPGGQQPDAEQLRAIPAPVLIELDPGLAFGTGTHPTTALCLEWLDAANVAGARVIDYGCGSGILAIAAAKLGAAEVLAIDIDPQALLATHDNAERNGVAQLIVARLADSEAESHGAPADILLANILAGPLESLAPAFASRVRAGGRLVLSGILRNQAEAVATTYAPWFDIAPVVVRDDWARLDGVRRPTPPPPRPT